MTSPMGDAPTLAAAVTAYRAATAAYARAVLLERTARRALGQLAGTCDIRILRTVSAVQAGHRAAATLDPDSDAELLYTLWQAYRREYAGLAIIEEAVDDCEAALAAVLHRTRLVL